MSSYNLSDRDASRRRILQATGASAVAVSFAGCIGGDDPSDEETEAASESVTPEATPEEVDGDADVPEGGDFRYGMSQEPAGLNPLSTSSAYSWAVLDMIYEGGTVTDPITFDVRPWVFTDWTVEGADTETPTVFIDVRDGLTFNDGTELSVDDVVFTYNYIKEQQPGRYVAQVEPIADVAHAEGDWDVRMDLERPIGTYDSDQLQLPILPKHVWSGVDEFQEYEPQDDGGPVGLGPGRVTRYEPDTSVEVEFRDDYELTSLDWYQDHPNLRAGGPFVDSVRYMIYGSSDSLQQAFLSEDSVDSLYGSILPSNVEDVQEKEGTRIVTGSDTGYAHYSFNMRNEPLDDTAFRQVIGFAFDDVYWTDQLNRGTQQRGNFVMPPGYEAVRPETEQDAEINEHPATKAFDFLESQPGVLDVEAVKEFLRSGEVVTGEAGSYANGAREYPGSLTGARTDHEEAQHDYTWGEVESDALADEPGVEEEIRVDGETIPELLGRPLEMLMYPPQDTPLTTQMVENFVGQLKKLGVPVERKVMTFNTMINDVYRDTEFDIFPMSWTNQPPFATYTLDSLFHSSQAHGPDSDRETILNNPMGYGLDGLPGADDLIDEAVQEMNPDRRNELARKAVEKIYLDYPTQINSYTVPQWPVREEKWAGFVGGIPSPGDSYVHWQFRSVHKNE